MSPSARRSSHTRWRTRRGATGRSGRWSATTAAGSPTPPCCACCARGGLILPAEYQRERRKLAQRRRAAFAAEPTGPNQVWQLDFSEFETTTGGTWRLAARRDYFSKYEFDAHVSSTANMHDAITAIEKALAESEQLLGAPLAGHARVDPETGEVSPVVTVVTDNGGPFRFFTFEAFIAARPELHHVRTKARTPG